MELAADRLIRVRDLVSESPALLNLSEDFVNAVVNDRGELTGHSFCIAGLAALDAGFITLRNQPREGTAAVFYDVTPVGEQHRAEGALWMFRAALGAGVDALSGDRLMFLSNWPAGYLKPFLAASAPDSRAKIAARRIDHFIGSGGRN